jgi:hypothetical protein
MRPFSRTFVVAAVLVFGSSLAAPAPAAGAATTERYFGAGAFQAVRDAVASTSRACTISNDGLTALVMAPVFAESSAATTASTAPSPMTLSRYDEWNGVVSTSMGTPENNYGLYAFRNPRTSYRRAFWHPGLGIWQYDTAGLGAPLTTVEAMDVRVVAGAVASEISRLYCASTATTGEGRRQAAWRPWSGCSTGRCETFFQEMYSTSPKFANLNLVAGIGPLGGVVPRTCILEGETLPCWYVDPRVGVIQGATAWATLNPLDGGPWPTSTPPWSPPPTPTPISLPFYVVDRGATEERHWMRVDTGYDIDIRASRNIGRDARPRSTQTGSGLTWNSSSTLCDITAGRGACVPVPPDGVSSRPFSASSGFRPFALDANGDGRGDLLWYKAGTGNDAIWLGQGSGTFTKQTTKVSGTYDDVLTGDVDGDGDDDVLWYTRSSGNGFLWRSDGDGTFTTVVIKPAANRRPFLLDANGDGDKEIFWYGHGSVADSQWNWNGSGFTSAARRVSGTYTPVVGDFDRNGRDDILWYAPASGDYLWLHAMSGSIVSRSIRVSGSFLPLVGDYDGDGFDDIIWYAPGTAGDTAWFGADSAAFVSKPFTVNGTYTPIVADVQGTGRDSVFWYAKGKAADYQFSWSATHRVRSSVDRYLPGQHIPIVGAFATAGGDGIVWYEPKLATDTIWYR